MATIEERPTSRRRTSGASAGAELLYIIRETDDDAVVMTLLEGTAPSTYKGLSRSDCIIEPVHVDTANPTGCIWHGEARYSPGGSSGYSYTPSDIGDVSISGDTMGGTQHITQGLAVSAYPGGTPDHDGAIGANGDSVEGCDIIVPVGNFSVTKVFSSGSLPSWSTLFALTGRVNNAPFLAIDSTTGQIITLAAGECLFRGASFGKPRDDGAVEYTYNFAASPNRTGLSVGSITGIAKGGWEYLWVFYESEEDTSANVLVQVPRAVYVHQVYHPGDFSGLG